MPEPSASEADCGPSVISLFRGSPVRSVKSADSPTRRLRRPGCFLLLGGIVAVFSTASTEAACLGYSGGDKPVHHSTPSTKVTESVSLRRSTRESRRRSLSGCVFTQEHIVSAQELRLHSYKFSILTTAPLKAGLSCFQEWEKTKPRFFDKTVQILDPAPP